MTDNETRLLLDQLLWSLLQLRRALVRRWGEEGWYAAWPEFSRVLSRVLTTHGCAEAPGESS